MSLAGNKTAGNNYRAARVSKRWYAPGAPYSRRGVTLLEMMIVVTIIAVIAGISFPALTSGLAGVRLASAAGSTASFLTSAMNTVERHEQAASIVISPKQNQIAVYT